MKWLILGAGGQLGRDVGELLVAQGDHVVPCGREQLDVTNQKEVMACVERCQPDVILHCAAYTDVDGAEADQKECTLVNVYGAMNVANAASYFNTDLFYISSDYVFGDDGQLPLEIDDTKKPKNTYGFSKLSAENEIRSALSHYFILRTSWVFGIHGNNFVKTMLRKAKEGEQLEVVDDQFGSPTYTRDLAGLIAQIARSKQYGIYHAANEGVCSWHQFAQEIFRQINQTPILRAVSSEQLDRPAQRQKNSRLSQQSLTEGGFSLLPPWQNALSRFLTELKESPIGEELLPNE